MMKTPLRKFQEKQFASLVTPMKIPNSPLLEKLGFGTGVIVFKLNRAAANASRSPWAIKRLNKKNNDLQKLTFSTRLVEEAHILSKLSHPNIVGFRSFQNVDGSDTLAMESCTTSLGDLLEKRFEESLGPLAVKEITKVSFDIILALDYLHNEAFLLHGDLKSFNVLIKGDFSICKLCDFGVSLHLNKLGVLDLEKYPVADYVGTNLWSAPEIFEEDSTLVSTKSEIFSFGLVIYEMIALAPPHTLEMQKKSLNFDDANENQEDSMDESLSCDAMMGEFFAILQYFYINLNIFRNSPALS